jgi:hypothetical protein
MPYTVLNADKGRTQTRDIVSHFNMQLEKFKSQYDDISFTSAFLNTSSSSYYMELNARMISGNGCTQPETLEYLTKTKMYQGSGSLDHEMNPGPLKYEPRVLNIRL